MYLSSPSGSRRRPAVTVFLPCSKRPDGSVYRYVASEACAAPSSSCFLALQHRRGRRRGRWWALLLLLRSAMCPSESLKGPSRRRRAHLVSEIWLSAGRAGFIVGAIARLWRSYWSRVREREIKRLPQNSAHRFFANETRAPAHFSETQWRTGPAQRSNQREATHQRKSSATRRQRRGCGAH